MPKYCYYNGKIIPLKNAVLPITDISILRGYGIFDFAKTYRGRPFLLKQHCTRLRNSAQQMNLTVPISDVEIEKAVFDLLKKNKMKDANIRIVLTGGATIDGLSFDPKHGNFFILTEPIKNLPEEVYTKGAKLITHEHQRSFFESKTTNYITAVHLQEKRKKEKAIEILYTQKGKILEATTSNFFIVKGVQLITPQKNILVGITRNFVIDLARDAGCKIVFRDIKVSELKNADEAFITATNKEIVPIVQVDNQKIGNGKVSQKTQLLMTLFEDYVNNIL